ncbi:MAG: hypothetical protein Q8N23_02180 [Archangium sp.]|nr:hypothetical protein [Archangium sp.]MDP3575340.1 hypothetical protein [Archangium sp.]
MRVWVTGGFFDQSGECFVEEVDLATGTRERLVTLIPPAEFLVPTKGFTGARWLDPRTLLVASFSAVWRFDVPTWACTGILHQPDFNDLHDVHVAHDEGRLFVCNTGLDGIESFDLNGRFLGRHSLSPTWFDARRQDGWAVERHQFANLLASGWSRSAAPEFVRAKGENYGGDGPRPEFHRRLVRDYAHPNHVSIINGRLAVTLLAAKEVRCLRTFETIARFEGHPHDAESFDGLVWTTTTDGFIQGWDPRGPVWKLAERYDSAATGHLGWCRGILASEEGVAVALTQMHGRPQYAWREESVEATETSVLWLERGSGRLLGRVAFGGERHAKLFAIMSTSCPIGPT